MAGKITNALLATITATEDSSGNVILNRSTGNPSIDSSVATGMEYLALGAGANVITLPISPTTEVYIKNIDSAKSIKVTWTLNGGASNDVINLNPGGQILLWDTPGSAPAAPGITALTLTPSAAGALVEYFFGG